MFIIDKLDIIQTNEANPLAPLHTIEAVMTSRSLTVLMAV
jgi:hypothetical protein